MAKTQETVSFTVSREDCVLIAKIVERARLVAKDADAPFDFLTATMDLTACHANGMPLNLAALAVARDYDFAHDVWGIFRHINRETGILGDCFVPRYASR